MREIWKFPLSITDAQTVQMPGGAEILSVQSQGAVLCLWALVNPEAETTGRTIEIRGTGWPSPKADWTELSYIGTVQQPVALVWHVFERDCGSE